MDIEIVFVVGADSAVRTIAGSDTMGKDLPEQLATVGYERSAVVTFTSDRRWAA
jgi:predicted Co/Zn/Cd cation transporter (cation efflux family)